MKRRIGKAVLGSVLIVGLGAPAASQAAPATGEVTVTIGKGVLKKRGVKAIGVAGAQGRNRVALPVSDLTPGAQPVLSLSGGLAFKGSGKERLTFRSLQLVGGTSSSALTGLAGGKRITIFTGDGAPAQAAPRLDVAGTTLRLTRKAAKTIGASVEIEGKLRGGRAGTLAASATLTAPPSQATPPPPPQVAGSCPTQPVSGGPPFTPPGDLPDPASFPEVQGGELVGGSDINWGVRGSFRSYVGNPSNQGYPAAGTPAILPANGATTNPSGTFNWPGEGEYLRKTVPGDDEVVIEGTGSVQFCYPAHGFRLTLANPAIVIDPDGADGRIVLDVGAELFGEEEPVQRVDFATLDLDAVAPIYSGEGKTATWTDIPAVLTAAGSAAMLGFYPPGAPLDPVTVTAEVAEVPDPFAATCPIADGAGDGPSVATPAAALPALAGAVPLAAGTASWGFKDSFQTYIRNGFIPPPPAGTVSPIGGATYSGSPAGPPGGVAGDFGFQFASGVYSESGTTGDLTDDRAVLETSGGALFCRGSHNLRVSLGQLTVVIDGASSRIVADADANLFGKTLGAQRVDLATLDLSGVTPTEAGGVITWANVPATLTQAGADATKTYPAGEVLDTITVSVDPSE